MFKKSFVLFVVSLFLSVQSFATEQTPVTGDASGVAKASTASSSDAAEADPNNKLDSELHIQDDLANASAIVASSKRAGATFSGEAQFLNLKKMAEKYLSSKDACVSRQAKAAAVCLESLSPELASATSTINMLVSTLGGVAVKDACSDMAKAMNLAKAGMSAYTSACGVMRAGCGTSCVAAKTGLEGMKTALAVLAKDSSPFVCPAGVTACIPLGNQFIIRVNDLSAQVTQELNGGNMKSVAGKASLCVDKYANLLASGAMGLASIMATLKQSDSCSAATDGSGEKPPDLTNLDIKCAMDQYKNTTECICHLNPRQTGCANSLEKANSNSQYGSMNSGSGSGVGAKDGSVTLPTGSKNAMPEIASKSGSSAGAGAPVGGGSGIGGGGSSGGGGNGAGEGDGHQGLNTNILSGSGGGGGGGWGGRGSSADEKYRPYLPGGAKDPQRGVAGQGASNEVTGQGGKSNWEKVRDRYRDNNSTLLNN